MNVNSVEIIDARMQKYMSEMRNYRSKTEYPRLRKNASRDELYQYIQDNASDIFKATGLLSNETVQIINTVLGNNSPITILDGEFQVEDTNSEAHKLISFLKYVSY